MHPTVDVELAAVRRSLEALGGEHELPVDVTAALAAAAKALQRVERSWARVLPYLADDSAGIAELLVELRSHLPDHLRADVDAVVADAPSTVDRRTVDVTAANACNEALREVLTRALVACSGNEVVRSRALDRLRKSLDNRPW